MDALSKNSPIMRKLGKPAARFAESSRNESASNFTTGCPILRGMICDTVREGSLPSKSKVFAGESLMLTRHKEDVQIKIEEQSRLPKHINDIDK